MESDLSLRGELQLQIMPVLWRLGDATVEEVRLALPRRYQSAYSTIQTVLNRLAERGLLSRERVGHSFVYRPRLSETDWLSRTIDHALAAATPGARRAVISRLAGSLEEEHGDLEIDELAARVERKRRRAP